MLYRWWIGLRSNEVTAIHIYSMIQQMMCRCMFKDEFKLREFKTGQCLCMSVCLKKNCAEEMQHVQKVGITFCGRSVLSCSSSCYLTKKWRLYSCAPSVYWKKKMMVQTCTPTQTKTVCTQGSVKTSTTCDTVGYVYSLASSTVWCEPLLGETFTISTAHFPLLCVASVIKRPEKKSCMLL